jgi:flagellin-specific chaperone FliS
MPFGASVANRFHIAAHNIEEAAKCYACERFDATTYHLMKVMEIALHCLAKRLHVSYSPNWGVYLDKIDKVLKSKARKSKLRKSRLRFLGNASALLRAVKEAWRDDSMHMGQKYGPDQARDIFMSVKAFMIHLSQELSDS